MRMPASTFKDLVVWQKAHQFVLSVYRFSAGFPRSEIYGLSAQFRRAAISIPANIAEGFRKTGRPEKLRFYNISRGSVEECRYYLILANDLGYGAVADLNDLLEETSKLLEAYSGTIQSAAAAGRRAPSEF